MELKPRSPKAPPSLLKSPWASGPGSILLDKRISGAGMIWNHPIVGLGTWGHGRAHCVVGRVPDRAFTVMKVRPMDQRFHSDLTFPGYLLNSVSISMYSQVHCWDGWGRTCPRPPGIPLSLRQAGKSCGLRALCVPLWLCLSVHPSLTPALPSHSVYLHSCSHLSVTGWHGKPRHLY